MGYDFCAHLGVTRVPKAAPVQAKRNGIGSNTSKMLLFAIEESGSGPPKGEMKLNKDDKEGTAAFVRSMSHFLNHRSVPRYAATVQDNDNPPIDIACTPPMANDWNKGHFHVNEGQFDKSICFAVVSPLVLFLLTDQGSLQKVGYTPFASPVSNVRSVSNYHVEKVCEEVVNNNAILAQEEFAVSGYQILLNSEDCPERGELHPMQYRCILNRDEDSQDTIVAKQAVTVTKENLERLYLRVSTFNHPFSPDPFLRALCLHFMLLFFLRTRKSCLELNSVTLIGRRMCSFYLRSTSKFLIHGLKRILENWRQWTTGTSFTDILPKEFVS